MNSLPEPARGGSIPHRRPTRRIAALAGVVTIVLAGCSLDGDSDNGGEPGLTDATIKLAASQTLSGPGAASCAPSTDAAQLWFDKVNAEGGVQGRQIEFEVLDDGYEPPRAIANVRSLRNEAFAMVGACGSATAAAIYGMLSEAGMPFLFPTNGVAEVVKPPSAGVFQVLPLYEDQTASMVRYGFQEFGPGSTYVVVNPLGAYESAIDFAKQQTEDLGEELLGSDVAQLGTPDYTPVALKIKQAAPDFVVMSMGGSDSAKFINALVDQDALPPKAILATTASVAGSFLNAYDTAAAEKLRFGSATQLPMAPDAECAEVLAGTEYEFDPIGIIGCGSAQAITTALAEADPLTRENVSAVIEGWSEVDVAPGIYAPLSFSAEDHVGIESLYIVTATDRQFTTMAVCPYGDEASVQEACVELTSE
jgi:branched-chain amino acid transport system substrate-binding protein